MHLARLQVGDKEIMEKTETQLREFARDAGFDVIDSAPFTYSPEGEHGYTLMIAIGQSSITFHTYPENKWVTVDVVTCGDYEYCQTATYKLLGVLGGYYAAGDMEIKEGPVLHSR